MYRVIVGLLVTATIAVTSCVSKDVETAVAPVDTVAILTKDDSVRVNCELVQLAAEQFASENNGLYPLAVNVAGGAGKTLLQYLPTGSRLMNPYTRRPSEPVDTYAAVEGETGYSAAFNDANEPVGYVITGVGSIAGDWIVWIENIPPGI